MAPVHTFFRELKRRHVYRVAVAYAVVAWFTVQAASIVVPELLLPAWITRAVIVMALLGFPLALVLAWAYDITPSGVQRTPAADDATPAAQPSGVASAAAASSTLVLARRPLLTLLAIVLVAGGGIGAYALGLRGGARVPTGDALLVALSDLTRSGRHDEAFDLAERAAARGATVPDTLVVQFTDRISVLSDPPGARVLARRFATAAVPATGDVVDLGTTPLRGVAVVRGDYYLRIEADGHAAAERIASSSWGRSTFNDATGSEVQIELRLLRAERVPADMVYVPGGRYQVASRDLQSLAATLDDFLIDRFEVSNARFAEFVDAGGYTRQEYWSDLAAAAGAETRRVLQQLVDRTGLPAPRGWSGQQHPPGLESHPVTGVSWYEAAAYCRYRQLRLPTLFEWEKTARDGGIAYREGVVLPWGYVGPGEATVNRANFNGSGTMPVGSYPFGISAFGAHDLAGNVKEWLRSRSESGRAVTGGSWADPIYLFSEVGSVDPATSSPMIGFRCARDLDTARSTVGPSDDEPIRLAVQTPVYRPVDGATFQTLLSHYRYDRRSLDPVIEERVQSAAWTRERIRYTGPGGVRVLAYLFLPTTVAPPYQTMVFVPAADVLYGNNVAAQAEAMLGPLVRAGRALFTVVMEGMTEREYPADFQHPETSSVAFRDQMIRRATELRTGMDYLETREDITAAALAYVGASWGAGSRLVFAAVDERFRAVVLLGAGIDERVHPTLPEASNINFAPYIRAPKLVLNGRQDEEHPWLTRGLPLWNLLAERKELALFDDAGHYPPPELRIPRIRAFLDEHLGAAGR
jgi:eukaryotic-like serine/threonine-protein kinase